MFGQCGSAQKTFESLQSVPELRGTAIAKADGGYCHTVALSAEGNVFTLGCGEDGQRGDGRDLDDEADAPAAPKLINKVELPGGRRAKCVAAGANHTLAVSSDATELFGWGNNECGQLGDFEDNVSSPVRIDLPGLGDGETITSVSAGYAHTAVHTSSGAVFTFGRGENGQLGHGAPEDSGLPTRVRTRPVAP